jgi:hypothetical protein
MLFYQFNGDYGADPNLHNAPNWKENPPKG